MSDAFLNNILVGLALVASNVMTLLTAPRMPRRLMLLLSSAGIAATLAVLGVYYHLRSLEQEMCLDDAAAMATTPRAEKLLEVRRNKYF